MSASFGRPDSTGRSSGKLTNAEGKLLRPPANTPWAWIPAPLIASVAWRTMSIHCRKLLDFLLVEHCNHAGRGNGRLHATYDQLEQFGIRRRKIRGAIAEAVRRGLVEVTQQGGLYGADRKRTPSLYRLTWFGCVESQQPATNEWKRYVENKTRVAAVATVEMANKKRKVA